MQKKITKTQTRRIANTVTQRTVCVKCKGKTVVNSIFGSICTNEQCLHEPAFVAKPVDAKNKDYVKNKKRVGTFAGYPVFATATLPKPNKNYGKDIIAPTKKYVGRDVTVTGSNGKVKAKIVFKKGVKTIHIPLGFIMELPDGSYCIDPKRDIAKFMENNTFDKRAKLTYHVDFNNSGVREIILSKK